MKRKERLLCPTVEWLGHFIKLLRFYDLQLNVKDESGKEITSLEESDHVYIILFCLGAFST